MRLRGFRGASFALLLCLLPGCARERREPEPPRRLEVDVFADSGRTERLHIQPPPVPGPAPRASVWLAKVAPRRPTAISEPLPEAAPAGLQEEALPAPPTLQVDPGLKPPILRRPGRLSIPPGTRRGFVDLDVRVGEDGSVTDALWAGGTSDSSLTSAAVECALGMSFFPALRAGVPTAVWTRQRFDFEPGPK